MTQDLLDSFGQDLGSGQITSSDTSVSSFMNYGSYSGADIKVIVHYPYPHALDRAKREEAEDLLNQMWSIKTEMENVDIKGFDPLAHSKLQEALNALDEQYAYVCQDLADIASFPTSKVLAELQTISWGVFREKSPVRTLGSVYPRAFTRGTRTIGGSMIFTVFHKHALHEILSLPAKMYSTGAGDNDSYQYTTNLPDQLPPLDLSLIFANEYGAISHMGLYGVEFIQEGGTFSIEDIFSENTVQYVARDIDPLRVVGAKEIDSSGVTNTWSKTASSLGYEKDNMHGTKDRRNPFI